MAILGMGLMGGSLGLALRRAGAVRVNGFARRAEVRRHALEIGAADTVFEHPQDAVRDAQLVVICTPVGLVADMAAVCLPTLPEGCVVTDVGSSKGEIVKRLDEIFDGSKAHFVGSHPLAGSERQGLDAARADLYRQAVVVLTPSEKTNPAALRVVEHFWRSLDAQVRFLVPAEHDRILAATSHLPHMVAAVLAATVGCRRAEKVAPFCGAGFWDATRIAEGDPVMWHDIVRTNQPALLEELRSFRRHFEELLQMVEKGDWKEIHAFLALARERRQSLRAKAHAP